MRSWLPTSAKRKNYRARAALNTQHYANDVKKFSVAGNNWYLMALYVEGSANTPPPAFTFSLSNDGVTFGPEEALSAGASASDAFLMTPSFVTQRGAVLGVLYGANPLDPERRKNRLVHCQPQLTATPKGRPFIMRYQRVTGANLLYGTRTAQNYVCKADGPRKLKTGQPTSHTTL